MANFSEQNNINTQIVQKSKTDPFDALVSDIPKASWEKSYFKTIDRRANEAEIGSLRNNVLSKEDFEIRIWIGFGLTTLQGFVLNRINGKWSLTKLDVDFISKKFVNRSIKLSEPKSGWDNALQKLIDAGILILPDATSIKCNAIVTDGFSYVIEIKKDNKYRTYMYDNPDVAFPNRCKEANQMVEIIKIIFEDFDLKKVEK